MRSKAGRKESALVNPTDVPTFSTLLSPLERRRRASSSRNFSTKSDGVTPNSTLTRRLKCLGQRHALTARASTDRFSFKWLSIQVVNSERRDTDWVWNCKGSEYCSWPPERLRYTTRSRATARAALDP